MESLPLFRLIFTRQWFITLGETLALPEYNRVEAIVEQLGTDWQYADLRMETPDTNDGKALSKFCRKLAVPLRQALRKGKVLTAKAIRKAQYCTHYFLMVKKYNLVILCRVIALPM